MVQNLATLFAVLATLFAVLAWCGCTTPEEVVEALANYEKNTKMETVLERVRSAECSFAFFIYHQASDAILFSGVVRDPSGRCEEEGVLPDAGGNKMAKHQVMVEIRLPRGLSRADAFTMAVQEIALEGFQLDAEYGAVPMEPAEDQVSELEATGDQIFLIRGILDKRLKETLSSIERVMNIFDEGRIEHFDRR